jgi:hypothetical protein
MLSSVLNREHAVQMNIIVMHAFVRLRELPATHKDLARKLEQVERTQKQHTSIITAVVEEIKKLKAPPAEPSKRRIGFHVPDDK